MCGRVQLTSEARYKYSDVAHCPSPMLLQNTKPVPSRRAGSGLNALLHTHVCARVTRADALVEQTQTLYLYLIITAAVAGRDFFFSPKYMSAIFSQAGRSVLEARGQTE